MSPQAESHIRIDLKLIADLIPQNSTVLDLGCGEGDLLDKLIKEKHVYGHGVEIFDEYICACIEKGVPVIHADLDEGLGDYPDQFFDFVILSRTLQVVKKPVQILKEIVRIGKTGIVSFPNFGLWKIRCQLFLQGKMPKTKLIPHQWYDTPNIHLSTIKDFEIFCEQEHFKIKKEVFIGNTFLSRLLPNLFAELAIFSLQKNDVSRKGAKTQRKK
jgi:methionine biosynthesis protein MetW